MLGLIRHDQIESPRAWRQLRWRGVADCGDWQPFTAEILVSKSLVMSQGNDLRPIVLWCAIRCAESHNKDRDGRR